MKVRLEARDGQRDNNAWRNLRAATSTENGQNRKVQANSKTGILGVSFIKSRGKFLAQIGVDGKRKSLGWYETADDAAKAYRRAKAAMHPFQPVPRE
jgi:hypothetical protein